MRQTAKFAIEDPTDNRLQFPRCGALSRSPMADEKDRKTLEERNQMSDLERLRHSCAHVLATAISRIWPDAQFAAGPPVEGGFTTTWIWSTGFHRRTLIKSKLR